jgi:uncharacterized phage protein (TIGR02220 family)
VIVPDIGYIKLYRKLQEWKWFQEPKTLQLFIYFLLNANFTEKEWQGITVLPGQLITSVNTLCERTGQTIQSIRTATDRLKSTGEITIKTTNRFSLVTVANWAFYQSQEDTATSKTTTDSTNKQQTNNKQTTTPKEGEEGKKEKKEQDMSFVGQIVTYLNDKSGKKFDPKTKSFVSLINARKEEGATIEDFKLVIDYKATLWKNDAYWKSFLRPSTLFAPSHFNEYLTEAKSDITIPVAKQEAKSEWQTANYHREE